MNYNPAYWISPEGEIIDIGQTKHIKYMRDNLDKFGFSFEEYRAKHKEFGEKIGQEGKARRELIMQAIQKGWLRIRFYPRPAYMWTINANRLDNKTKSNILKWLEIIEQEPEFKNSTIKIDTPSGVEESSIKGIRNFLDIGEEEVIRANAIDPEEMKQAREKSSNKWFYRYMEMAENLVDEQ